jgi:tetratricopeptide (TPR) repeat protein
MVIDPRRDHSIRIPRPDLSDKLKSPNACNKCHPDKSNQWAAGWCREWYGDPDRNGTHFGEVFWAGRQAYPEALPELIRLANDHGSAPMVRATAVSLLQNYQDASVVRTLQATAADPDPLIRYAAISALFVADENTTLELAIPRLGDSVRLIRTTAAFQLARIPAEYFSKASLRQRDRVLDEYRQTQMINADHPSAHMNLGILALNQGDYAAAETSYKKAVEVEPALTTAYVNLADLYRMLGRDQEGEQLLRDAISQSPDMAAVHYALGLNLVRKGNHDGAMKFLQQAASLEPGNARYAYVYGVGLHSTGQKKEAVDYLEHALVENPFDRDLLYSLSTFNQELGNREHALKYAEQLVEYYPSDQNYQQLIRYLRTQSN